jgi:hypothetical protein
MLCFFPDRPDYPKYGAFTLLVLSIVQQVSMAATELPDTSRCQLVPWTSVSLVTGQKLYTVFWVCLSAGTIEHYFLIARFIFD